MQLITALRKGNGGDKKSKRTGKSIRAAVVYSHRGIKWQIGLGSRQLHDRWLPSSSGTLFLKLHEAGQRRDEVRKGGCNKNELIFDAAKANRGRPLNSPVASPRGKLIKKENRSWLLLLFQRIKLQLANEP